jgi:hypothetical protein
MSGGVNYEKLSEYVMCLCEHAAYSHLNWKGLCFAAVNHPSGFSFCDCRRFVPRDEEPKR